MNKQELKQVLETIKSVPTAFGNMHSAKKVEEAIALLTKELERVEEVGTATVMPKTPAFTMVCFLAADVPVGTKLYTHPQSCECCKKEPIFHQSPPAPNKPEPRMP